MNLSNPIKSNDFTFLDIKSKYYSHIYLSFTSQYSQIIGFKISNLGPKSPPNTVFHTAHLSSPYKYIYNCQLNNLPKFIIIIFKFKFVYFVLNLFLDLKKFQNV